MTIQEILDQFKNVSVLVIGDICLDRWCVYDPAVTEPSRETGIPRLGVVSTEVTPGAGGTIANNLVALGAGRVTVLGAIGDDGSGYELERALRARGIESSLLVKAAGLQTFTYTKLLNAETGQEDQPRIDFINTRPLPRDVEQEVLRRFNANVADFDVILVSDQAETGQGGVVTSGMRELLAGQARRYCSRVFWVDSRARCEKFRNVIVKPNKEEADAACDRAFGAVDYQELRRVIGGPFLLVTHGTDGVLVVERNSQTWVPTTPVAHPVDICGAGDSFSAGAALALKVTGSPYLAARLGNLAASVTIMKKGTGTASPEEILAAAEQNRQ